jgi:hypothetical protein
MANRVAQKTTGKGGASALSLASHHGQGAVSDIAGVLSDFALGAAKAAQS